MRRLKLPHCCLCSPAYCSVKEIFHALLHFIQGTRQNRTFQMLLAASKKIQTYLFCGHMDLPSSGYNSVFLFKSNYKSLSTERAIFNKVIVLIIVCFGSYRFVPFYVRFNRRNWYKKILPEGCASLYVQISTSHLEFCSAAGKNITFIYKPQIKKGNEICLKRIRQSEKSLKQKMAYILWVRTSNLLT